MTEPEAKRIELWTAARRRSSISVLKILPSEPHTSSNTECWLAAKCCVVMTTSACVRCQAVFISWNFLQYIDVMHYLEYTFREYHRVTWMWRACTLLTDFIRLWNWTCCTRTLTVSIRTQHRGTDAFTWPASGAVPHQAAAVIGKGKSDTGRAFR